MGGGESKAPNLVPNFTVKEYQDAVCFQNDKRGRDGFAKAQGLPESAKFTREPQFCNVDFPKSYCVVKKPSY